ncbi:MAG: acyl-CoA dehydratase activase [Promethearchaeota archaeon]
MKKSSYINEIIGINIGSVSVNVVFLDGEGRFSSVKQAHLGNPQKFLSDLLNKNEKAEYNNENILNFYGVCGTFGSISDILAVERGLKASNKQYDIVLSLGGESFVLYILDDQRHITNIISQDKCAAGSGEFFIQQIERLNITLEEAIELADKGKSIQLASRCSVHCKSDITHKLNKQEARLEDILSSLLNNMVNKAIGLIYQSKVSVKNILLIGGLSLNRTFVKKLRAKLPDVLIDITEFSHVYEAYGTALLVQDNPQKTTPDLKTSKTFRTLGRLKDYQHLVKLMEMPEPPVNIDQEKEYILGIDVGSTTTKAVVMDEDSSTIIGSFYGRTNGNPIKATKICLQKIVDQIGEKKVKLVGVTGSGRQMVGAYLGTSAVFNEISAHSMGAAFFDKDVDTIFEIGGQDSKYMFLQNGVPVDYAMNASCSAGTGSFLEESAKCDLDVKVKEICDVALVAENPVRFKADCAAFINSDIRTAMQEGYKRDDIIGGLVYSISNNYLNKVKGTRPIGKKIFFQGGVAKNNAVGYAFAQATGREIIIPPFPELMGAFGIALISKFKFGKDLVSRMEQGTTLSSLIKTEMKHIGHFVCKSCKNYCKIERYQVGDRKFPFGGQCTRWEHQWKRDKNIKEKEDLVAWRNSLMYKTGEKIVLSSQISSELPKKIGIPRALLTHSLYPLFSTFFTNLGFEVVISEIQSDMQLIPNAPFCYPMQIFHGAVADLIHKNITLIFLPQIHKLKKGEKWYDSTFCPVTQSGPYLVAPIFENATFLTPELNFEKGYMQDKSLIKIMIKQFNFDKKICEKAYKAAVEYQESIENKIKQRGKEIIKQIQNTQETAIVVVGRSYNVYPRETSQSVPKKLTSMGMNVIPFDFLDTPSETDFPWYFANYIEEALNIVKENKNLFLLYISNFSCTIDAFMQNHVRTEMKAKPYLLLELDSHIADAGTQTRLEAFLEIIKNYQQSRLISMKKQFNLTKAILDQGKPIVISSSGEKIPIRDPRVKIYLPCFSKYHTDLIEKLFANAGLNMGETGDIKTSYAIEGLKYCTGKECIPLPIVLGQILDLVKNRKTGEIIGFFMLTGGSPCVVYNYNKFINEFLERNKIRDVFQFTLDKTNDFMGIKNKDFLHYAPKLIVLGDIIDEIASSLQVVGIKGSLDQFHQYVEEFMQNLTSLQKSNQEIDKFIEKIKKIPIKGSPKNYPKVLLTGDFFVRFSSYFLKELKTMYANGGVIVKSSELFELFLYGVPFGNMISEPILRDRYITKFRNHSHGKIKIFEDITPGYYASQLIYKIMKGIERRLRKRFDDTGLLFSQPIDTINLVKESEKYINPLIYGEAVLSVGKSQEILKSKDYDGLILIGPQYCLPYRISQGIIKPLFIEQNFPYMAFDAEISAMSPNTIRLIEANIQQINRKFKNPRSILLQQIQNEKTVVF